MTNEQRKAIDRLKQLKDYSTTYYGSMYFKVEVKADDEMKETIDTVLSIIKEQQEEIEKLKNKEVLIKRYFKKCDLIKQKDKIIDLMARAIDNYDSQLEINTFKDKEHIKQYFVDLVEKE